MRSIYFYLLLAEMGLLERYEDAVTVGYIEEEEVTLDITTPLAYAFRWASTEEGHAFWSAVNAYIKHRYACEYKQ